MAANFWTSSHLSWLMPKERLAAAHPLDRARGLGEHDIQQIKAYFAQYLVDLGNRVRTRQRVVATAVVYFRRFYATNNFAEHDPGVIAAGSLYLAGKVEEAVVGAKQLLNCIRSMGTTWGWPCELKQLLDAEMLLIEQLDAHLIVFSPYLSLTQLLQSDPTLADLSQNAWAALNDSYRTDVALVYPPYLLAVAAVYLASVICSRDLQAWMEGLAVDMNHVYDITMELVHMYDHYRKPISPEQCRSLLAIVRAPVPPSTAQDATAAAALAAAAAAAAAGAGQPPPFVAAPGGTAVPAVVK